jgi:zinc protease
VTGAAMLVVWATANPGVDPVKLEAALWNQLAELGTRDPSSEEVERTVTAIETRQVIALQKVAERADQISMFTTLFGEPERINSELDRYREVTPEEIAEFARDFIVRENSAVLTYLPRAREEAA